MNLELMATTRLTRVRGGWVSASYPGVVFQHRFEDEPEIGERRAAFASLIRELRAERSRCFAAGSEPLAIHMFQEGGWRANERAIQLALAAARKYGRPQC